MYSKKQFGKELKSKVLNKENISKIGEWSHSVYMNHILDIDLSLRDILLNLNAMEMGPEFERSYEELEDIADRLIAGEDVKL